MISPDDLYKNLKDRLGGTLKAALSVAGPKTLRVNRIWADDPLDPGDIEGQFRAKVEARTWGIPIYGDISLVDPASGKELSRSKKLRLMDLPKLTPRYSFIVDGEEFQVANQLRLKPGVYAKSSPYDTTIHFKFPIGFSKNNHSFHYEPKSKKWYAAVDGKTVPLYSYLHAAGVSDDEISSSLGAEALDQMKGQADLARDVAKIRTVLTETKAPVTLVGENEQAIRDYLYSLPMTPDVPKLKYGKTYNKFEKGLVVDALKNMGGILSGDEDPDIDNSRFKEFRTFDDILVERIDKASKAIQNRIKLRMREKDNVRDIIQPEKLSDIVVSFFNRSQLSNYPTQSNPVNFISGLTKTTVFGEGSIGNKRAVVKEDRDVDPSMFGVIDPLHTPEGGDIGAVMHVTVGATKGDGVLLGLYTDPKTGAVVKLPHTEIYGKRISFPGEYRKMETGKLSPKGPKVRVMHRGRVEYVSPGDVDLVVERPQDLFDFSTNLVPFVNAMHGGRALMASKMYDQAVAISDPEVPLVRSAATPEKKEDRTFENLVGHLASIRSPVAGVVTAVGEKSIIVKGTDGKDRTVQIYKDFPLNARSYITSVPAVSIGSKVTEDQVLADSNFTRGGSLAIGKNLRMALVPYRGWNYEDGIVLSESAAKKLTSGHIYKVDHRPSKVGLPGRDRFSAYFPNRFAGSQLEKLDEKGIIKVGQKVRAGDPVFVHLEPKDITPEDVILGKISRNLVRPYSDASQVWDEPFEGTVTHVEARADGGARILIKTEEPLQVGDKIVPRYAAKGVVTRVMPDHDMPHTTDGKPLEVLINPMAIPSRMNPSLIYEALAGKIAEKTKKPYIVDNFEDSDLREVISADLKKHGISDTEEVIDPVSGRSLGQITVGNNFVMKLEHASKEKFNARDPSSAYTADLRPAKSGEGAQTIGHMEQSALMSHGAMANLRDMASIKATKSDEFWRALQMNEPLPPASPTFAFDKFTSMLKGAGINVERRGTVYQLKPLNDEETLGMSAGSITNSRMLLGKNLKPEEGGLFDESVTGGLTGQRWSHIDLPYEVPNPVFEHAIKGVLGLTQREFDDIMEERATIDRFGRKTKAEEGGLTGPAAIRRMMDSVDVPKAIRELRSKAKTARGSDLNSLNRAIRFLSNMQKNDIAVSDLFISKVPVLPPVYRPVYPLPDGTLNVSDVNYLYRDLVAIKGQVQDLQGMVPDEHVREHRADLYQAVKAVVGVGDPISSQHYRGLLDIVTGEHPKGSYFQNRVIRKQQELSGRASIVGDPTLGMDEVGVPEDMAWVIFKPFIVQKLSAQGIPPLEGEALVKDRAQVAKDALARVMAERPVIINRAPTLHKHGILAMKPVMVPGHSIHMNQLVTVGFNADFDGDTVGVHVPVTNEALQESFGMMPSAVPLSTSERILTTPRHEALTGLYKLTASGKKTDKSYMDEVDAIVDFHEGKIAETDVVRVGGSETTVGRILVNKALPPNLRKPDLVLNDKSLAKVVEAVARENPKVLAPTVDVLKDIGNEYAFLSGVTISLGDLGLPRAEVDTVMQKYDAQADEARKKILDKRKLDDKIVEIYSKAIDEIKGLAQKRSAERSTNLHQMVVSGGRGSPEVVSQMLASPILAEGLRKTHPYAIRTGYAHGMSPADYWVSNYSSRRGAVETKISTAEPGALTKSMVQTSIENRIVPGPAPDFERGLEFDVDDREGVGRYIMKEYPTVPAHRGDLFSAQMAERFRAKGVKKVELGSPLTSTHPWGTYAMSYGLDERGNVPRPGAFVGITASQAIGEPMTQLILKSKHVQGVTGQAQGAMTGFERLESILTLPEEVRNKALIAMDRGTVEKVTKAPGGWDIRIGGKSQFTPFQPVVKPGASVNPGDRLSHGMIDPRDLLNTKGIDHVRRYMTDEIYDIFGGKVKKKHIETVVRSATDTALVTDAGNRENLIEGDIVPLNLVRAENSRGAIPIPIELARNAMLMEEIEDLGGVEKILTDDDVQRLAAMGKSSVVANPNPVRFRPVLKGVETQPMVRKDWMAGLSYRRLKDVIQRGVAEGWKSDVRGWNPVPGLAYGATVSEPPTPKAASA